MSFSPKLVALDIDGTLFANVPSTGQVEETIRPAVIEAVHRAYDAGVHVVLATGRSTFGITHVWDMLGLPADGSTVLSVASNGSVTFGYPPLEVHSTVTFDAREIVTMLMEHVPQAAVAVEEVGVGYRINRPFPEGEITGRMVHQSVEELVAEPVTRVIIRDPQSSEEEFLALAEKLGMHGTNYFIGWTAWLDIAPEGVSKASALAEVAEELGVDQADVLAIGDGRNDIEMLRWAGRGVAMGQAPLEVQEAADGVTETVENDGAAVERPGGSDLVLKLVATDLDGTLLHTDGTVTARTREALTAVEDLGVTVVFVTGRPIRWMSELWQHVGDHGLAICSNGGIVYDVPGRVVRRARPIPVDVGLEVADLMREHLPGTTFGLEKSSGFAKERAFMERTELADDIEVGTLPELFDADTVKLLARHDKMEPERFWAETERLVGHLVTTTSSSLGALVEISAAGVTKATTLALLCDELGITSDEVVAFGDMPNDLAMLEWVGTSYAMANAHPTVLELADRTAPANERDGVAAVLEEIFALADRDRGGSRA